MVFDVVIFDPLYSDFGSMLPNDDLVYQGKDITVVQMQLQSPYYLIAVNE